ncbi:MAG: MscL family protein [Thermoplasmata archaeon]
MGIAADFKKFVLSGTLVTLAVAFVVGLAIVALITAFVSDIIDPLIAAAGHVNFANLGIITINGSPVTFGAFVGAIITFLILMIVVFFAIAYPYQLSQDRKKAREAAAAPTTKECPFCHETIPIAATRCGHCTSQLPVDGAAAPPKP